MTTPTADTRTAAVVVAAGRGTRYGAPKHRLLLGGVELWQRSVDTLTSAGVADIVVVGDVPGGVSGSSTFGRARSSFLIDDVPWVLIHDAARPLVTVDVVHRVIERLTRGDVDGVVPAVSIPDTVKRVRDGMVTDTVDRRDLVTVQTPQGFRLEALRAAHRVFPGMDATDDAGLVEANGGRVATVDGDVDNFKVTFPNDLERAERIVAGSTST
ncbi:2-C-methyl-D-erythritol 4-phosphate cytidylyltransferase [Actinomycetota bacterium]